MDQCSVKNQVTHATAVCDGKSQSKISLNNQVCRTTLHERTRKHSGHKPYFPLTTRYVELSSHGTWHFSKGFLSKVRQKDIYTLFLVPCCFNGENKAVTNHITENDAVYLSYKP